MENYCSWSKRDHFKPGQLKKERAIMALERFWWGPSLDLLRDSHNGALWLEHCFILIFSFISNKNLQEATSYQWWFVIMTKDVYKVRNCQHSYREKKGEKSKMKKLLRTWRTKQWYSVTLIYSHVVNLVSTKALINITKDL